MVKNAKIVIGANFGDEGKGLMTNYFSHQAALRGESCINVLHNGGAQRGHTVEYPDGVRHVFRHFGSGSFEGAHTYFSEDFILNPIIFRQEWEELERMGVIPEVYAHHKCRVTTPYDMMLNQIIEESRGQGKHGSVGLGINETIIRHCGTFGSYSTRLSDIISWNYDISFILNRIRLLYMNRRILSELVTQTAEKWSDLRIDLRIRDHYLDDLAFMMARIKIVENNSFLNEYNTVVFEGGQGLMLDQNNEKYFPHLTPSNTGLKNPMKILMELDDPYKIGIEACYVTRSYVTRHGAGRLDNECSKEEISPLIKDDITNVSNPHQGSLRYAPLDLDELYDRVYDDFLKRIDVLKHQYKISLALTHLNEYDISRKKFKRTLLGSYRHIYNSNSPYISHIVKLKN